MTLPLQPSSPIDDSQGAAPSHDAPIPESTGEIIIYILERFHNRYRRDLPRLIVLARKVESVHGDHPEAPKGLADFLAEVAGSLDEHMQKEEQILFSMSRGDGHAMISRLIGMMRMEHDDHASNLDNILALTNGLKAPEGACGSWRALYEGLGQLRAELKEQIRIENEILFPASPHSRLAMRGNSSGRVLQETIHSAEGQSRRRAAESGQRRVERARVSRVERLPPGLMPRSDRRYERSRKRLETG